VTDRTTALDISKADKRLARRHADEAVEIDSAVRLVLGLR
jgi:hypothetical protein